MRTVLLLILILFPTCSLADSISGNERAVRNAYKSIPHRQTTYSVSQSLLDRSTARLLSQIFTLVDEALILRTQTLLWFTSGKKAGVSYIRYKKGTDRIIRNLSDLLLPQEMVKARDLIVKGIKSQSLFYKKMNSARNFSIRKSGDKGSDKRGGFHSDVKRASSYLISAYNQLKKSFSNESTVNQQAFFDHLCALDFI